MEKVRRHIIFSGRVQGVGFRYHALHIAQMYGLTGWVDNLYDGRVEMEVQGDERGIYTMLTSLEAGTFRSFIRIDHVKLFEIPVQEEEYDFIIK